MKGQYKTKKGELLKVISFDSENEMVYVENNIGQNKWYHKPDYSTWVNTADSVKKSEAAPQPVLSETTQPNVLKEIKPKIKNDKTSKKQDTV